MPPAEPESEEQLRNGGPERLKLALINPNAGAYSETFVQAHREQLDADVSYFTGHPRYLDVDDEERLTVRWKRVRGLFRGISGLLPGRRLRVLTAEQRALANALLEREIQVVLAEFGPAACEVLPACQAAGIPLVPHFHGYDASRRTSIDEYSDRYPALFAYSSEIISVSTPMTRALVTMGAPPDKILYNPCGPADEFFRVTPDYKARRLLAVGRFVGKKGPHFTIRAFAMAHEQHPDASLTMVGDGVLLAECRALVEELGVGDAVALIGAVSHGRVRELMSSSRCFLQHSVVDPSGDSEGTPVAVLEAQASGLPVVATRHGGIQDVVVHEQTGLLVEERDVKEMASCIVAMLDDSERCARLGASGRKRVHTHFSITHHIEKLDACLARARKGKRSSPDR